MIVARAIGEQPAFTSYWTSCISLNLCGARFHTRVMPDVAQPASGNCRNGMYHNRNGFDLFNEWSQKRPLWNQTDLQKSFLYTVCIHIYVYIYLYIDYVHERQNDLSLFLDTKQNTEWIKRNSKTPVNREPRSCNYISCHSRRPFMEIREYYRICRRTTLKLR